MTSPSQLEPPYPPTTLPPWQCGHCGQRNSGWSRECGRCETVPPHVPALSRPASWHAEPCLAGRHFECGVLRGSPNAVRISCQCACHEMFQETARRMAGSDRALVETMRSPYVYRFGADNRYLYISRAGWEKLLRRSNGDPDIRLGYITAGLNEMGSYVDKVVFSQ